MSVIQISESDGEIRFPNRRFVGKNSDPAEFGKDDVDPLVGGEGWITYKFNGGEIEGRPIYSNLAFQR